jgi:hypothetical protein
LIYSLKTHELGPLTRPSRSNAPDWAGGSAALSRLSLGAKVFPFGMTPLASQTHEHGRFRPRQRTRRPGGQRRHYATTLAARHGLALRDRGEAGTREVPAPRGPRSEASRWQTPPACTAILQPETGSRYRTGKRRGPARVLPPGAQVRSQPVADATRMYG